MFVVGMLGGGRLHPTRLTPNEEYTHMSLWCLLASPLLLGCDLTQLDDFTLSLLSNDEVIEVDQDPLGRQGQRIHQGQDGGDIYCKPLAAPHSFAVALLNRSQTPLTLTVPFSELGLGPGSVRVRNLWSHQDQGSFQNSYTATVDSHAVVLLKVTGLP